ncbi:nicotinate-nucleotide--dimethylbenzimidazole phosphoribosyltransferase [Roseovarius indicus]|uniref:Nicotinate-nucleotide--dimethylbenzimidazole phosphoribosyltransferase n=1 Tax=Roseovarius indicus TaxID=540747 RepID=A0A0T5PCR5_9RHOB|nr:nicotinate-nucleotide--dimethylbenzimidazole phosphoribosyltransferase [Roseovarius indicus]KRS18917.1 nicotinate-nucleotide--dimethylbenzimidazole phosphoribosyltransferase [Roseovarius indicus]QEW26154.1 Nicotinate-nucleotide--dimethylbenzimidazole phosphoribosyltransferase [Roseovarius indicus]SFD94136.1 nicotinate-nucleotide-dimethylbenzimidazole phosphoribosyltransferase [Roseovarius indicus]
MHQELNSVEAFSQYLQDLPEEDAAARAAAQERNGQLTKPPGALGRLEDLAAWYCAWRGDAKPEIAKPQVIVFAGNHGVTAQGISAFPADVTVQMVANFEAGGAAINQLAKAFGAKMDVHALELDRPTADFTQGPAMDEAEFLAALKTGWEAVDPEADLLVVGEMGIGNTTAAAAMALALFGGEAGDWTGRGTGVSDEALQLKAEVVARAVAANAGCGTDGLEVLRCLGGREIAAMAGAMVRARVLRIPMILDGFICTAAGACLEAARKGALDHAVAGHVSAEAAHPALLARLGKEPLLAMGMRLGEGSGAALAMGVLKGAVACHSGMATFAEAGVSGG